MSIIKQLKWRYATKVFSGKKISQSSLNTILEAIRLSPSSFGVQPYHVTVVENIGIRNELQAKAWGQKQITTSSHLLVFSSLTDMAKRTDQFLKVQEAITKRTDENGAFKNMVIGASSSYGPTWSAKQAYIALGIALATCAELGIDSCPMEGFDPNAFKNILKLPADMTPQALLAIGYRAKEEKPGKKVRFDAKELFDFRK